MQPRLGLGGGALFTVIDVIFWKAFEPQKTQDEWFRDNGTKFWHDPMCALGSRYGVRLLSRLRKEPESFPLEVTDLATGNTRVLAIKAEGTAESIEIIEDLVRIKLKGNGQSQTVEHRLTQ